VLVISQWRVPVTSTVSSPRDPEGKIHHQRAADGESIPRIRSWGEKTRQFRLIS